MARNLPTLLFTRVSRFQKGKTNLDFSEARDSEWQLNQLRHMHYASVHLPPDRQPRQHPTTLFLQAGCPSCCPTNSIKALKAIIYSYRVKYYSQRARMQWIQMHRDSC